MFKKAQAAMEFLMTYGWAILVVLVAIGALAYFGVLSPDRFLPERCSGPSGLDCLDKASINDVGDNVSFVLKNNLGFTITGITVTAANQDCTLAAATSKMNVDNQSAGYAANDNNLGQDAQNAAKIKIIVDCGAISAGRFKTDLTVQYTNSETGLSHAGSVQITGVAS